MTRPRRLVAGLVGVAALAFAATAGAAPPAPVSATGGVVPDFTITTTHTADGNTFQDVRGTVTSNGTLTGAYVGVTSQRIRGDTGTEILVFTFTGSTPCGTGSFDIRGSGKLINEQAPIDTETGRFTSVDDSSNTIGIHVNIDFTRVGLDLTFTGTYHCT